MHVVVTSPFAVIIEVSDTALYDKGTEGEVVRVASPGEVLEVYKYSNDRKWYRCSDYERRGVSYRGGWIRVSAVEPYRGETISSGVKNKLSEWIDKILRRD